MDGQFSTSSSLNPRATVLAANALAQNCGRYEAGGPNFVFQLAEPTWVKYVHAVGEASDGQYSDSTTDWYPSQTCETFGND